MLVICLLYTAADSLSIDDDKLDVLDRIVQICLWSVEKYEEVRTYISATIAIE